MRILYIDIDSQRPDHLGCYGYHRNTSPNIDRIAAQGVRFENCYITDAPCLPSRTALWSGLTGFHNGVVNHGGEAAQPFIEGPSRGFRDYFGLHGWMRQLRDLGYRTATISSFGERHSAYHWYAGYNEIINPGKGGLETADEVAPLALDWLRKKGAADNWFLHVNFWDPHTPYNTPANFANPFADEPVATWYTEEMRQRAWAGFGPHCAQEPNHYDADPSYAVRGRGPHQIDSMASLKQWVDGYDTGIRFMDDHLGHIFEELATLGILDETVIVIGADHGENLGELNVWGDHQTADAITCRVPLIIRWPGVTDQGRVDEGFYYHFDWAATLIELLGGTVPALWDGKSFAQALRAGKSAGRPYLVTSQNAWACQRAVRFDRYLCMRTYHDGFKELEPVMLFDLVADPHEQSNLAEVQPEVVNRGLALLEEWTTQSMLTSRYNVDPLMTVLREGGPYHCRGYLAEYQERLKNTNRKHHAERLQRLHGGRILFEG